MPFLAKLDSIPTEKGYFMNHSDVSFPHLAPDERIDEINEHLRLIQKKQGLTFGTDAYLLAAYIRPQPSGRAVDLGSGTGILPLLLLAREKISSVHAVEIQPAFAELIERNAALNGFADRITPLCRDVRALTAADVGKEVDLVFSNPPYMRPNAGKKNEWDEKYIARHEVHGGVSDFCAAAGRLLRHGGRFVTVLRPDRLSDLVDALRCSGLEPKRMTFVHADADAEPCTVLTEAVKGGAPGLRVTPPLLLYQPMQQGDRSRTLTLQAQQVYDTCRLYYG